MAWFGFLVAGVLLTVSISGTVRGSQHESLLRLSGAGPANERLHLSRGTREGRQLSSIHPKVRQSIVQGNAEAGPEPELCGGKTCVSNEKCAHLKFGMHEYQIVPRCIPPTSRSCKNSDSTTECDPDSICAEAKFTVPWEFGSVLKLCVPQSFCHRQNNSEGEACGESRCSADTKCAQQVPEGRLLSYSMPTCIPISALPCERGQNVTTCGPGHQCARTKMLNSGEIVQLCIPTYMCKSIDAAAVQCGETICAPDRICAQAVARGSLQPVGPRACIPLTTAQCQNPGDAGPFPLTR
jgi:hypothetical protein